jgi:hypothetical protein
VKKVIANTRQLFLFSVLLLGFVAVQSFSAQPALADASGMEPLRTDSSDGLWFKNRTDRTVLVALRYYRPPVRRWSGGWKKELVTVSPGDWVTTGWYRIEPGQRIRVYPRLHTRYFYFHAYNNKNYWGDRARQRWVKTSNFSIEDSELRQMSNPKMSGFILKSFRQIDVGNDKTYTVNLTLAQS